MYHNEHRELARLIWSVSEILRDIFRPSDYPDVILPLTLLRRLDCALAPTRALILKEYVLRSGQARKSEGDFTRITGLPFYNVSGYDLAELLDSVKPYVPDTWVNTAIRDPVDGTVGQVGYAIHFNRLFYRYQQPRSLAEIEADIRQLAHETEQLLRNILDR